MPKPRTQDILANNNNKVLMTSDNSVIEANLSGLSFDGTTLSSNGNVSSVNGQTGDVVLTAADVGADVSGTASSAVATHSSDTTSVHGITDTTTVVIGPASATDNALCRYDTTTGKSIQSSDSTLSDAGALAVMGSGASVRSYGPNGVSYVGLRNDNANNYIECSQLSNSVLNIIAGANLIHFKNSLGTRVAGMQVDTGHLLVGITGSAFIGLTTNDNHSATVAPGIKWVSNTEIQIAQRTQAAAVNLSLVTGGYFGGILRATSYTVATLPSSPADGQIAFASNGRKNGEGVGSGTGVFVYSHGGTWYVDIYNSIIVEA